MGKKLNIADTVVEGSEFNNVGMAKSQFTNINMSGVAFEDINFSDISVKFAQMGGARFCCIGLPPEARERGEKQRPVWFEHFDLNDSTFKDGNLANVEIINCTLDGMKIDGALVTDMIAAYKRENG